MTSTSETSPDRAEAAATLDVAARAADAYERPDLAAGVRHTRQRLDDPAVHVLVVGEFKQGKSSLVNALLGVPVCPVDDDVATSVPTSIRHADEPHAQAEHAPEDEGGDPRIETIDLDGLADRVSEAGNPDNEQHLRRVEVGLPHPLLARGLVLVDTPGVGGLGSVHQTTTVAALAAADAVLFVSDASSEYSAPELAFLDTARQLCPNVVCVLTKIDLYPAWRKVLALDEDHLRRAGIEAPVLAASATLAERARRDDDAALHRESGYADLERHLVEHVLDEADRLALRSAAQTARSTAEQLERSFRAEREALADPEASASLVARLEETKRRAQELRSGSSQWQQTLSDGMADLSSDVDYDLRARIRTVTREGEEAIDAADPAETWEQFEAWLYRRVHAEIAANYALLTSRTRELAATVAEQFGQAQAAVTAAEVVEAPTDLLDRLAVRDEVELETTDRTGRGLSVMRSSYGGVLMFGMLGRIAGMGMINPFSVAMGLVLGRKALKEQREREVEERRQQAKRAQRSYLDEVSFEVGKDSRDTLRQVQRSLRDAFAAQAEELQTSTQQALTAAEQAVTSDRREREHRLADVDAELERIAALRGRADALLSRADDAASPAEGATRGQTPVGGERG